MEGLIERASTFQRFVQSAIPTLKVNSHVPASFFNDLKEGMNLRCHIFDALDDTKQFGRTYTVLYFGLSKS